MIFLIWPFVAVCISDRSDKPELSSTCSAHLGARDGWV